MERFSEAALLRRCPKCGYDPVMTTGSTGKQHGVWYEEATDGDHWKGAAPEHLEVSCARCRYKMLFAVLEDGDGGAGPRDVREEAHRL